MKTLNDIFYNAIPPEAQKEIRKSFQQKHVQEMKKLSKKNKNGNLCKICFDEIYIGEEICEDCKEIQLLMYGK